MIVDGLLCDVHSSRHLTLGYISEKKTNKSLPYGAFVLKMGDRRSKISYETQWKDKGSVG